MRGPQDNITETSQNPHDETLPLCWACELSRNLSEGKQGRHSLKGSGAGAASGSDSGRTA
jgi:hypothetical protein